MDHLVSQVPPDSQSGVHLHWGKVLHVSQCNDPNRGENIQPNFHGHSASSFAACASPPDPRDPQTSILTDASTSHGWGAHWEDKTIQGIWSPQEAALHINVLEMKTVLFALQAWAKDLSGMCVLIRSDNTTVVQYVIKQG